MRGFILCMLVIVAASASAQGLEARDLNGDGTVDAYYERSANLTWLANMNSAGAAGVSTPLAPPGQLLYSATVDWLSDLDVYGVTGWRLPDATFTATVNTSADCAMFITYSSLAGCYYQPDVEQNELAHLIAVTLGNAGGVLVDAGPFQGLTESVASTSFWMNPLQDVSAGWPGRVAHYYETSTGRAFANPAFEHSYVWGVRDGDVAPVPEPSTYLLMLAGLGVVLRQYASARARNAKGQEERMTPADAQAA